MTSRGQEVEVACGGTVAEFHRCQECKSRMLYWHGRDVMFCGKYGCCKWLLTVPKEA